MVHVMLPGLFRGSFAEDWVPEFFFPSDCTSKILREGGGNSNIFNFHPNLGKMIPCLLIFFRWVGSTTKQWEIGGVKYLD